MKTLYILTVGLSALLFSCGNLVPSTIEFDGKTFELPIKVDKAKEALGLQYEYYSGFFTINENVRIIETQLKGYPLFMGSENDPEENYNQKYIVGITFFKENKTIEQFKDDLENQYHKKFKTVYKEFVKTRTSPPFSMTYHYVKTDEGLFIALKEIMRKPDNKKYVSISFYKGISESKLAKYLRYVN